MIIQVLSLVEVMEITPRIDSLSNSSIYPIFTTKEACQDTWLGPSICH